MARSYRARALAVMRQNETAMAALYAGLARDIGAVVQRRADADGNVPRQATFEIQQQAGELVRRLFLGRNGRGEWAPFDTVGNGAVIPLSPYMRQLWSAIRQATRIPVEQSAAILERRLPLDVLTVMRAADVNPFVAAKREVAEMVWDADLRGETRRKSDTIRVHPRVSASHLVAEQLFRPNPLAAYEPAHTWVDPNGYRLSDRIWNTAGSTRQRLDAYLEQAIREGRGALQMSRELEQFLIPGQGLRTSKPYGANASFDGMRLARTEISRAAQEAQRMAATMNPFVSGMKWNLSASHPKIDICDDLARGGPQGDGVYSLEAYPGKPHPQCLCWPSNVLIEKPDAVIAELRADIRRVRADLVDKVGPLLVEQFEKLLLGQGLEVVGVGPVSRVIAPVVAPPVVAPAVVVPPPPPVNLAAQARLRVLELDREYERLLEAVDEQILTVAGELTSIARNMDQLEASLLKRQGTPAGDTIAQKIRERRVEREQLFAQRLNLQMERNRLMDEQSVRLRQVVQVDRPAGVTMQIEGAVDPATQRKWQRGTDEFNALISADVAPGSPARFGQFVGRENYDPNTRIVQVQATSDTRTVIHELGHWLEDHNPDVHRKVVEFYERRTQGYALEWLGPGYDRHEVARKDKFLDLYMGKEYVAGGDRYATEILSMGLDHLYNKTALLARRDPEMFDFIFNVVRGLEVDSVRPAAQAIVAPTASRGAVGRLVNRAPLGANRPMVLSAPSAPTAASLDDLRDQLDDVFRDYRAAKTAGDSARMSLLRGESERLKNQIELLEQQRAAAAAALAQQLEPGSAAAARAALAEAEERWLAYQDDLASAYADYNRFTPAIRVAMDNRDDDLFDALVAQRQPIKERLDRLRTNPPAHPRSLVYVEQASNTVLSVDGAIPDAWQEGIAEFNKMVSSVLWRDKTIVAHGNLGVGSGREYALVSRSEIFLNPLTPARTVVHELAHILESDPETLRRVLAFYDARTAGDVLEPLRNFSEHFNLAEVTRRDRWIDPYIGKDYQRTATEIVSMGVEWMYERPIELARQDPEFFDFIYNLLRGR